MGSFIKHRNAYLDDEITTESQLFKVRFPTFIMDICIATTEIGQRSAAKPKSKQLSRVVFAAKNACLCAVLVKP